MSNKISDYISNVFGLDFLENYRSFLRMNYPAVIRLKGKKDTHISIIEDLGAQGIRLDGIENFSNAYRVLEGGELIGKTIHHTIGSYYIQSLSSMIPPLVLNPRSTDIVLDLCSAPGSKTTQLSEIMNYSGTLIANEPNLNRIKALIHNLDRMNSINIRAIKEKGELLSKKFINYFDKILVDAPCSALGVIQKKQEVSNWWNSNSVDVIAALQLKLLISALKMLKKGGELVYSTCTLTIEENEQIINKLIKKYPVELVKFDLPVKHINGYAQIQRFNFSKELRLTKRILPWEIESEGFFVAKLRKNGEVKSEQKIFKQRNDRRIFTKSTDKILRKPISELSSYFGINIRIFDNYKFIINGNDINFTNLKSKDDNLDLYMRIGTKFGMMDKNGTIKLHSHAAQIIGKEAKLNIIELNKKNDLSIYFSGGIINMSNSSKGQKLILYNNKIIGTAVCLGDKLKSQFPRSKRTGSLNIP